MSGKLAATLTGSALRTIGFDVIFNELYTGELFEVITIDKH
jgi:hypothetical protein